MKCPVCDNLNTSVLCPRCGFDASRDYEKYPTFGIVGNAPAISALREEQDLAQKAAELEKQQLLDRVAELERQVSSMMETNRLLLEKLSKAEHTVHTSAGQKPNRLRSDHIPVSGKLVYSSDEAKACPVFRSKLRRRQISSVTFLDTLADAPQDAWDVSADKSGSVMAWAVPNGVLYDLYLAADGKIEAPDYCDDLFAGYCNMRMLRFGNCFQTSSVKYMRYMFWNCSSLTELDLTSFDTSSVQNMCYMFSGCSSLVELNLRSFDTSNVQNMWCMFKGCNSLTTLKQSRRFVTDQAVTDQMFDGCPAGPKKWSFLQ
ncbi:MAG: BspA family leucine-rich repeat surface protein [Oscillospiraceae bacterium]|nr:BspA family leucine-rich repeat surface protein [Oscillospiraceae bacterium]